MRPPSPLPPRGSGHRSPAPRRRRTCARPPSSPSCASRAGWAASKAFAPRLRPRAAVAPSAPPWAATRRARRAAPRGRPPRSSGGAHQKLLAAAVPHRRTIGTPRSFASCFCSSKSSVRADLRGLPVLDERDGRLGARKGALARRLDAHVLEPLREGDARFRLLAALPQLFHRVPRHHQPRAPAEQLRNLRLQLNAARLARDGGGVATTVNGGRVVGGAVESHELA